MNKKSNKQNLFLTWPVVIISAALLVIGGAFLLWPAANNAPETGGTPQLVVAQPDVDEGYLQYDTPIQTAFSLRNNGNAPLKILDTPVVELKEGC